MKIKNKENEKLLDEIEHCICMINIAYGYSNNKNSDKLRRVMDFVVKCPLVITGLNFDAFKVGE